MFGRNKINLDMIVPTSKVALKTSCLRACNNNVDEAMKLYDFYAKDLPTLPDFDVVPPTAFQQAKSTLSDIFSWADQNQDKIISAYNFFQQIRTGQPIAMGSATIQNVPPIPNE
jgi:hypothetical protein